MTSLIYVVYFVDQIMKGSKMRQHDAIREHLNYFRENDEKSIS